MDASGRAKRRVLPAHAQTREPEISEPEITIDCELSIFPFGQFIRLLMEGTVSGPGTVGENRLQIVWTVDGQELQGASVNIDIESDGSFSSFLNQPQGTTQGQGIVSFMDTDTFGDVTCTDTAELAED